MINELLYRKVCMNGHTKFLYDALRWPKFDNFQYHYITRVMQDGVLRLTLSEIVAEYRSPRIYAWKPGTDWARCSRRLCKTLANFVWYNRFTLPGFQIPKLDERLFDTTITKML